MKFNVDAIVSRHGDFGAIGAMCKDHEGNSQGASAIVSSAISDPPTLESLAVRGSFVSCR